MSLNSSLNGQRLLSDFVRKSWYIYACSILFHLTANLFNVYFPKVLGQFTDDLDRGSLNYNAVLEYSLVLLSVGILYVVCNAIAMYLIMRVGRKFEFDVRGKLFRHFSELSESFYSKNGTGKLLSYFMNDVTAVRESISIAVNQAVSAIILLVLAVTMMLAIGIPLYLIVACVTPLLFIPIIVTTVGPTIKQRSRKVQEALGAMTETAEEQFGGMRVTKKFAVEPIMNQRFGKKVDQIRSEQLSLVKVSSFFQASIPFLGTVSLVIALAFGGYLTVTSQLSIGNFVALTLYIRMLMNPLQQIGNVINTIQRSRASLERLSDLLAMKSDIQEIENPAMVQFEHSAIHVEGLSFAYRAGGEPVLKDINLHIKPGTTVGIIGKTGSGKTTLMKLLLRLYDPPSQTIFIGGEDIRDLSLENLRTGIGYVPQDGFLFSMSLRDNIAFSNRAAEDSKVESAAKHAQIYDSIQQFPNQFETRLGERGLTLSGGQRQRTALARGLMTEAPMLLLDDSVSAVDAVTETKIIDMLKAERKNKTTVIIAHRISAVKHADEIIVLDEGRIVGRGTHKQLIDQNGLYAELYAIQKEGDSHAASAT